MMKQLSLAALLVLVTGYTAVAQPPPPGYAPIPPPRYEAVPPPPGGPMVWQPGHWHWDGVRYVWIGGHYVPRFNRPAHWVPGHWVWQGRWVWVPAHWG